jgi:hypothetical protein
LGAAVLIGVAVAGVIECDFTVNALAFVVNFVKPAVKVVRREDWVVAGNVAADRGDAGSGGGCGASIGWNG